MMVGLLAGVLEHLSVDPWVEVRAETMAAKMGDDEKDAAALAVL
jgi:hypothetical protein